LGCAGEKRDEEKKKKKDEKWLFVHEFHSTARVGCVGQQPGLEKRENKTAQRSSDVHAASTSTTHSQPAAHSCPSFVVVDVVVVEVPIVNSTPFICAIYLPTPKQKDPLHLHPPQPQYSFLHTEVKEEKSTQHTKHSRYHSAQL